MDSVIDSVTTDSSATSTSGNSPPAKQRGTVTGRTLTLGFILPNHDDSEDGETVSTEARTPQGAGPKAVEAMKEITKAVRMNDADMAVVAAVQRKLGLRSVSEVLRMGLRALAREQGLERANDVQPQQTA